MDKDSWQGLGCLIVFVLLITTCTYNSYKSGREKRERKEFVADSIAEREKYIKDSIDSVHNSPEYKAYQDSLRLALEKKREDKERATVVFVCPGDNCYHFMTQCIGISDIGRVKLMSEYQAIINGLEECFDCVRDLDGYIALENIHEYISEHYSKSEIIEMFDITGEDLYDDRDFEEPYNEEPYAPSKVR